MTRAALIVALCALALVCVEARPAAAAKAEPLWLVVGAADPTPGGIARKAKLLAGVSPGGGLVVRLDDCQGERKPALVWATTVATSAKEAQAALHDVRDRIKKATIKRCDAKPGSLLALGIPAVDRTIGEAPRPSPSWTVADRMTKVWPVAAGRAVVVVPYFVHQPEDPLEGRRERVLLVLAKDQKKVLTDDCPSAASVGTDSFQTRVTLHCGREPSGADRYHQTLAFDAEGTKLADIPHCRAPRFVSDVLVCYEEVVNRDGVIVLSPKHTRLTK